MRWTPEEYAAYQARRAAQGSEPKRLVCDAPVVEETRKDSDTPRLSVRITSCRSRLIDPDNLCGKYFVDALRYCGLIPNDRARDIVYQITQKKVGKDEEATEIIIEPLPTP